MIRKYGFYLSLIVIYLLFLSKDGLIGLIDNKEVLANSICEIKNSSLKKDYEELTKLLKIDPKDYNLVYSRLINRNIYDLERMFKRVMN